MVPRKSLKDEKRKPDHFFLGKKLHQQYLNDKSFTTQQITNLFGELSLVKAITHQASFYLFRNLCKIIYKLNIIKIVYTKSRSFCCWWKDNRIKIFKNVFLLNVKMFCSFCCLSLASFNFSLALLFAWISVIKIRIQGFKYTRFHKFGVIKKIN